MKNFLKCVFSGAHAKVLVVALVVGTLGVGEITAATAAAKKQQTSWFGREKKFVPVKTEKSKQSGNTYKQTKVKTNITGEAEKMPSSVSKAWGSAKEKVRDTRLSLMNQGMYKDKKLTEDAAINARQEQILLKMQDPKLNTREVAEYKRRLVELAERKGNLERRVITEVPAAKELAQRDSAVGLTLSEIASARTLLYQERANHPVGFSQGQTRADAIQVRKKLNDGIKNLNKLEKELVNEKFAAVAKPIKNALNEKNQVLLATKYEKRDSKAKVAELEGQALLASRELAIIEKNLAALSKEEAVLIAEAGRNPNYESYIKNLSVSERLQNSGLLKSDFDAKLLTDKNRLNEIDLKRKELEGSKKLVEERSLALQKERDGLAVIRAEIAALEGRTLKDRILGRAKPTETVRTEVERLLAQTGTLSTAQKDLLTAEANRLGKETNASIEALLARVNDGGKKDDEYINSISRLLRQDKITKKEIDALKLDEEAAILLQNIRRDSQQAEKIVARLPQDK